MSNGKYDPKDITTPALRARLATKPPIDSGIEINPEHSATYKYRQGSRDPEVVAAYRNYQREWRKRNPTYFQERKARKAKEKESEKVANNG